MPTAIQNFGKSLDIKVVSIEKLPPLTDNQRAKLVELSELVDRKMYKAQAAVRIAKETGVSLQRAYNGVEVMCERGYLMYEGNIVYRPKSGSTDQRPLTTGE